jgi:hypothetical protein
MLTQQIKQQIELQQRLIDALQDKAAYIISSNDCLNISHLEDMSKEAVAKQASNAQELLEQRIAYYTAMTDIYHIESQLAIHQKILHEIENSSVEEQAKKEQYKPLVESLDKWKELLLKADKIKNKLTDPKEKKRVLGLIQLAIDVQERGSFDEKYATFLSLENLQ